MKAIYLISALLIAGLSSVPTSGRVSALSPSRDSLAVADFDYSDTSKEATDQQAQHSKRIADFTQTLRKDVAAGDRFTLVDLHCPADNCSAGNMTAEELVEAARQSHADILVFGGIRKMSTLVQWIQVRALDLRTMKVVADKTLTFRGDSDDAWQHAARYVGGLIDGMNP